jgi:DNA-binding transcriptional regulator YdaS (Cro superfamily)
MNIELKVELIRRFGSQVVAARQMGIREAKLSYIVRGHSEPSEKEREAIERALGAGLTKKLLKRSTDQRSELARDGAAQ